jgi:hypothetical protein
VSALDDLKKLAALGGDDADLDDEKIRTILRSPFLYERFRNRLLRGDLVRTPKKPDAPPVAQSLGEARARRLKEITKDLSTYERHRDHLLQTGEPPLDSEESDNG